MNANLLFQGALGIGVGEKFDQATGHELPVGSYALMPNGVRHFVWVKGETVIQVSGMGPFEINCVNPADDPRKVSKESGTGGGRVMMGQQSVAQEHLFYSSNLEAHVPGNHLLRGIDCHLVTCISN